MTEDRAAHPKPRLTGLERKALRDITQARHHCTRAEKARHRKLHTTRFDPRTVVGYAQVIGGEQSWADRFTAYVNHTTAYSLERKGMIEIRTYGGGDNEILLTKTGVEEALR